MYSFILAPSTQPHCNYKHIVSCNKNVRSAHILKPISEFIQAAYNGENKQCK